MSHRTTIASVLLAAALAAPAFAEGSQESGGAAAEDKVIELKLGHVAEADNPYALGAAKLAELVAERTGGKVVIKLFPSGQLGTDQKLIESLMFGSVDFALTTTAVLGQFEPDLLVYGFPYIFDDRAHAYRVLDTLGLETAKSLEGKGIKVMGYFENGIRHMINNKRPIRKPADMKGLKMRVMTAPVYVELMKALGSDPTPMAMGEVYSACATGTVDGLEVPAVHIFQKRYFEVNKYISLTGHTYESEPLSMSMKTWMKLPPAYRKIVEEAVVEATAYARKLASDSEADFFRKIEASGKVAINEVDVKPFRDATTIVWDKLKTETSAQLIGKIAALRSSK